ncbi:RDD family protein [bacterium]|nr:RDD family protein [bacterium]
MHDVEGFYSSKADKEARAKAFMIDFCIIAGIQAITFLIILFIFAGKSTTEGIYIKTILAIVTAVNSTILIAKDCIGGRSIGKRFIGIMICDRKKRVIPSVPILLLRNLTYLIWPLEILVYCFGTSQRRLGDMVANTDVYVAW